MSDNSRIEWTDATWNPVTGCTEVSPGCDRCYAKTFAERWRGIPGHHFENGFDLTLRNDKLIEPLRWRKPRRVFVNSMSDLFHDDIPTSYIAEVFAVMAVTPQHTYQVLTKRHGRMRSLLQGDVLRETVWKYAHAMVVDGIGAVDYEAPWPLPNVWLGVSVEDQHWADIRIPALLETPAAVRWLSCEPLLGPVDLTRINWPGHHGNGSITHLDVVNGLYGIPGVWKQQAKRVDWVVAGGESGPGARPMHPDWARGLRDQCDAAGVPFFFKQWGESLPLIGHREYLDLPPAKGNRDWSRPFGDDVTMCHVGKKAAGRALDGRTWDEYPAGAP